MRTITVGGQQVASEHFQPNRRRPPTYCVTVNQAAVALYRDAPEPGPMVSAYSDTVLPQWMVWHQARGLNPFAPRKRRRRSGIAGRLRQMVIARDGLICQLCRKPVEPYDVHIDHVLPVKHGGPDTLDNLQVAHSFCNLSKGARV